MESVETRSKHISTMPDEVFEEIFSFLYVKNLLTATLVCKEWNRIISRIGSKPMKKLVVKINCPETINAENIRDFKLTRQYNEVSIDFSKNANLGIIELNRRIKSRIFKQISASVGSSLTKLSLNNMIFKPEYMKSLSLCTNIKLLKLDKCVSIDADSSEFQQTEFKMLNELHLLDSPTDIVSLIKCARLDCFFFQQNLNLNGPIGDSSHIIAFLNQLAELDDIRVSFRNGKFNDQLLMPKFKLKELHLSVEHSSDHWNGSDIEKKNMASLCKSLDHNATAEINLMEIPNRRNSQNFCDLASVILNNCKGVKTLSLLRYGSLSEVSLQRSFDKVEDLEILIGKTPREDCIRLMKKFPNVKELGLRGHHLGSLESLPATGLVPTLFKNVEKLQLNRSSATSEFQEFEFPALKSLVIIMKDWKERTTSILDLISSLKLFCSRNTTLTLLTLERFDLDAESGRNLLNLYNEMKGTSVTKCVINLSKYLLFPNVYMPVKLLGTRDEEEAKLFGRILTEDEKKFFEIN